MTIDYDHFKQKLETEKELLEKELAEVGRKNPDDKSDWEATPPTSNDGSQADDNLAADRIEDYEENMAIVNTLESRYNNVKIALDKVGKETYGLCEIGGEEIDAERLEANPSARTCREHM